MQLKISLFILASILFSAACTSTEVAIVDNDQDFKRSSVAIDTLLSQVSDYSSTLNTIQGKGKAIVSEPGNNERVTVYFSGDRERSLVTVKNALGIEGGQILSKGDSLLIYNKVDKVARKLSVLDDNVTSVGHLASVNILEMMNFVPVASAARGIYESDSSYLIVLEQKTKVYIDKNSYNVIQVDQPVQSDLPYSRIVYEAYGNINGFKLPRRVTIFSADSQSKVQLLIQSLEVNPGELELNIDLPNDVKFVTQ